jgi:hypothetical protein
MTPRVESLILVAGSPGPEQRIPFDGHCVGIYSSSALSVELAFDNDAYTPVYPGMVLPSISGFTHIRVRDHLGAGSAVILVISPDLGLNLESPGSTILAAIAVSVAKLEPGTVRTQFPRTVIGVAGAATSIFAANANRKAVQVQADINNAGTIWIGSLNTVSQALSWFELLPGASSPVIEDTVAIWACSENGTEWLRGYEIA